MAKKPAKPPIAGGYIFISRNNSKEVISRAKDYNITKKRQLKNTVLFLEELGLYGIKKEN